MTAPPPRAAVRQTTHRLIASRFPTVGVFDSLTEDPEALRVAFLLETATNDRFALLTSRLEALPDSEVASGPTASLVMAAFLHADPAGGRFTDARLGAWYAAFELETAIAETLYHSERRLRLSDGGFPSTIQLRELIAEVDCLAVDIRRLREERPELYDPDPARYGPAQAFGAALRWPPDGKEPADAIAYDSVRRSGGTNLCVYRPSALALPVVQGDHYGYHWDAAGAVAVTKLSGVSL